MNILKDISAAGFALILSALAVNMTAATVSVADVEQLYAAVINPAHVGATVVLAPGIYSLSARNPAGVARPNGGRLELLQDMSLSGLADDRLAVVIDATSLPASSFTVSFGRTGVIRVGRGTNAVEWLTVLGTPDSAAGIATELTGTASTHIKVAHVIASGSSRGIDVRNVGASMIGRWIDAELIDNECIGPAQVVGMSEGIRVANFVGADHGVVTATLSGNRIRGFQLGCIVANNRSSNAAIRVRSSGDHFFANARGALITGGLSQSTTGFANANTTVFDAYGSAFVDNTAAIPGIDPGGIRVAGGLSTTRTNVTSGNLVSVSLTGCKVADNQVVDFEAFGAIQTALAGLAGINNHVTLTLRGVSAKIPMTVAPSLPADPSGSNTVTVARSPEAH